MDIACIQETRWKGEKSRDLGDGFKLLYKGASNSRNGVGIVVSERLRDGITGVDRVSDRLMSIKLVVGMKILRVVTAYAPQAGCTDEEKDGFWQELDDYVRSVPSEETLLIGADLNGHVGEQRRGASKCHGNHGYGIRNDEGERILEFATAHELALANTYFIKKDNHLVTYASGERKS